MTKNNLNEIIETTLNQHGMNAVVDVVFNLLEQQYKDGYESGEQDGWSDCYDTFRVDIEEGYDD